LTDGQANRGITDPVELASRARDLRTRRITTSTLGLGEGFNEFLLGRLAEEGGGAFYFAERAEKLAGIVGAEIGAVLSIVAPDVTVRVRMPEGIEIESLNAYPYDRDGADRVYAVGSLSSGQSLTAAFRVKTPSGTLGQRIEVEVRVADRNNTADPQAMVWTRATAAEVTGLAVDVSVTRVGAQLDAAAARRSALELNQKGQAEQAGKFIDAAVAQLNAAAGGDAEIVEIARRLAADREQYVAQMSTMTSKGLFAGAYGMLKQRRMAENAPVLRLVTTSASLLSAAQAAAHAIHGMPGLPPIEVDTRVPAPTSVLSRDAETKLLADVWLGAGDLTIIFVEQPLADAWFSHWHAGQRVAVVSSRDFTRITGLPIERFVAYEVLLHGLRAPGARYDPLALLHRETRGCLFDLCIAKAEIAVKLRAPHICADCVRGLGDAGVDAASVVALWDAIIPRGTTIAWTIGVESGARRIRIIVES